MDSAFQLFYQDYIKAKRVKKYHKLMDYVENIISNKRTPQYRIIREYNEEQVRRYHCCDEYSQIAISICLKSLPRDRANELCAKLFPDHNTHEILEKSYEEGNVPSEHIVHGYDMLARDGGRERMQCYNFTENHVQSLLNELTLVELANIAPKIEYVTYYLIQ